MKDYYNEISFAIQRYEEGKYCTHSVGWITDRISWCYAWKKISKEQMESLADRIIAVMKDGFFGYDGRRLT